MAAVAAVAAVGPSCSRPQPSPTSAHTIHAAGLARRAGSAGRVTATIVARSVIVRRRSPRLWHGWSGAGGRVVSSLADQPLPGPLELLVPESEPESVPELVPESVPELVPESDSSDGKVSTSGPA